VKKQTTSYLKIAHRGASGYEPENTIRAFEKAIALGADMIELDVHLSRDGHLIVIHDARIDGMAVVELTLAELKGFDVGKGERIPTLQETIDCVKGRCQLYIELKGEGTEQPVVDLVRMNDMQRDVILASFDPAKVRRCKELAPELATAVLTGKMDIDFVAFARDAFADCIHFCWEQHPSPHTLLTDTLMKTCADAGLKVVIWHEERPEEIREIVKRGIYGICSNLPDLLEVD
jgi:glycerophosphoryl diester phosphodiesterase